MKQRSFYEQKSYRFKRFARKAYSAFNSLSRVVTIGVLVGSALIAVPMSKATAQSSDSSKEPARIEKELEEVIVAASLAELPLAQATKAVTVITRAEIEQAPINSIEDLLVYVANVDVVQRGQHGVQADISIRGGTADQTAILLNGINLSNSQTGHYNFDIPINISDILRIEILHGPAALVYGVSAFSGGINIITQQEVDNKVYIQAGAGMHKLRNMEIRGATNIASSSHSLSVGYKASDGYIANSDYNIFNILWQSRLPLNPSSKIDIQLGYNDKQYGANTFYSPKYPNQYERTSSYMATVKGTFGTQVKFTPAIYWQRHHDQFDLVKDTDFGRNYHRNDLYGASLVATYRSSLGHTAWSGGLRREDMLSTKLGKPMVEPHRRYTNYDDRTHINTAIEHTITINKWTASAGMLVNNSSLESNKYYFLPSVGINYRPTAQLALLASWSKATRIPTFTDLGYSTETHSSNQNLQTEHSQSVEVGAKYNTPLINVYGTAFLLWGRNMIDWVKEHESDPKWKSWNHSQVDKKGIELGIKLNVDKLLPSLGNNTYLKIDYTQLYQKFDSKDLLSLYTLNYLKRKMTAQLHHGVYGGLSVSWYFRYQKRAGEYEQYVDLKSVGYKKFPAFSTLDVKVNYAYNNLNIHLKMNNLYNTRYYDLGNIPQARFWLMGGISYSL